LNPFGRAVIMLRSNTQPEVMKVPKHASGSTGFNCSILGIGGLADRTVPLEQCVANRTPAR
jgi:hypothetical protein